MNFYIWNGIGLLVIAFVLVMAILYTYDNEDYNKRNVIFGILCFVFAIAGWALVGWGKYPL